MNGTRIIWALGAVLVAGAVAFAVMGRGEQRGAAIATPAPAPPARTAESLQDAVDTAIGAPTAPAANAAATVPATASTPRPPAPQTPPPRKPLVRDADALDLGMDQKIPHATVVPGNIVRRTDPKTGKPMLLADGRYEIRGAGTKEDPYLVSWECLASASETYQPRLKQEEFPQRVAMLNGAWVRLDGYLAFPLMVSETDEALLMLNQWDGCCIGVPPTPYDAIELKLAEKVRRTSRHATFNFGGVAGQLRIEPLLVEGWLAGLYLMEHASLQSQAAPEL